MIRVIHCYHCEKPFDVGDDIYKVEESHGVLVNVCIRCLSGIREHETTQGAAMRKKHHTKMTVIEPKPERVVWKWVLRQIRNNFTKGSQLSMAGISRDLGVSKTTVRKAIKKASRHDRETWGIAWVDASRGNEIIIENGGKMHLLVSGRVKAIELE